MARQAFVKLADSLNTTPDALLSNASSLTRILSFHVVPDVAATSDALTDGQVLRACVPLCVARQAAGTAAC